MKKQNVRTLTLIVSTFSYLLVGAAIFDALESNAEDILRKNYKATEDFMLRIYNISQEEYTELENIVISYQPHKAGSQWKFSGAFYFSLTVITTIGYGHSCPTTIWGKSFCMIYAVIGIPLCLVMFQSVGERLNNFASWCITSIKKSIKLRQFESTQTELVIVGTVLAVGVVTGGAAMFRYYEKWTYFDSVYYCFITLTTIGFGDYVALQTNEALNNNIFYVVLCMTFILFGLTVVASSMNLLVLRFLTMNTEDERREEIQSAVARSSLRYESGHITPNGTLLSPIYSNPVDVIAIDPNKSDCGSCRCWAFLMRRKRERKKFTVRRMPGKIAHLVPLQRFDSVVSKENLSMAKPSFSDFPRRSTPKTGMMSFDLLSRNRCSSIVRRSNSEFNPAEIATARDFARPSTLFQYDAINIRSQIDVQRNLQENSSRLHLKRSSV